MSNYSHDPDYPATTIFGMSPAVASPPTEPVKVLPSDTKTPLSDMDRRELQLKAILRERRLKQILLDRRQASLARTEAKTISSAASNARPSGIALLNQQFGIFSHQSISLSSVGTASTLGSGISPSPTCASLSEQETPPTSPSVQGEVDFEDLPWEDQKKIYLSRLRAPSTSKEKAVPSDYFSKLNRGFIQEESLKKPLEAETDYGGDGGHVHVAWCFSCSSGHILPHNPDSLPTIHIPIFGAPRIVQGLPRQHPYPPVGFDNSPIKMVSSDYFASKPDQKLDTDQSLKVLFETEAQSSDDGGLIHLVWCFSCGSGHVLPHYPNSGPTVNFPAFETPHVMRGLSYHHYYPSAGFELPWDTESSATELLKGRANSQA